MRKRRREGEGERGGNTSVDGSKLGSNKAGNGANVDNSSLFIFGWFLLVGFGY